MSEGTPDLVAVETTGVALQATLSRIEQAFAKLLELNPLSTKTLRACEDSVCLASCRFTCISAPVLLYPALASPRHLQHSCLSSQTPST